MNKNLELKRARSYYYEFFSMPFFFHENDKEFKRWKEQLLVLSENSINEDSQNAFNELKKIDFTQFFAEQNAVLFDLSYINVPLNVSFYEEGRDDGAARLRVIDILKRSPYRRDFDRCKDSEDFVGFVFLMMSTFLKDELENDDGLSAELFSSVINVFVDEFCRMLKSHKMAKAFKFIAVILENFIALDRSLLAINPPIRDDKESIAQTALNKQPYQTKMPTAKSKIHWEEFTAL